MTELHSSGNLPTAEEFYLTTNYNQVKFWRLYSVQEQQFIATRLGIGSEDVQDLPKLIEKEYLNQQLTALVPSVYLLSKRYDNPSLTKIVSNLELQPGNLESMAIQQYHLDGRDVPHLLPSKDEIHSNLRKMTTFDNWKAPNFLNLYNNEDLVQAFPLITTLDNPQKVNIRIIWKYCQENPVLCRFLLNPPSMDAIRVNYGLEDLNYILKQEGIETEYDNKPAAFLALMQLLGTTNKQPVTRQEKRRRGKMAEEYQFTVPHFKSNKIIRTSGATSVQMHLSMIKYLQIKFDQVDQVCTITTPHETDDWAKVQLYKNSKEADLQVPKDYWVHARKCNNFRFVIIPLQIRLNNLHSNVLLYDRKDGVVEWFEPHGKSDYYENLKLPLEHMFKENLEGFKVLQAPTEIHEGKGLQHLAEKNESVNENHEGFCGYWVIWYLDLRLSHPDKSRDVILEKLKNVAKTFSGVFHEIIKNYYQFMQQFSSLIEKGEINEKLKGFIEKHMQPVNAYGIIPESWFITKLTSKNIETYLNRQQGITPDLVNFMNLKPKYADLVVRISLQNGVFSQFDKYLEVTGYHIYRVLFEKIKFHEGKESLLIPLMEYSKEHPLNNSLILAIAEYSDRLRTGSQIETDAVLEWFKILHHSPARYQLMKNYPLSPRQLGLNETEFTLLSSPTVVTNDGAFAILLPNGSVKTGGDINTGGNSDNLDLTNVWQICRTKRAFAALKYDGTVVSWGDREFGGDSSSFEDQLKHVHLIGASDESFVVVVDITTESQKILWWNSDKLHEAGDSKSDIPYIRLYTNTKFFVAIKANGDALTLDDNVMTYRYDRITQVKPSANGFVFRDATHAVYAYLQGNSFELYTGKYIVTEIYTSMSGDTFVTATIESDKLVLTPYSMSYRPQKIEYGVNTKGRSFTPDSGIKTVCLQSNVFIVLLDNGSVLFCTSLTHTKLDLQPAISIYTTADGFAVKHENNTISLINVATTGKYTVSNILDIRKIEFIIHNNNFNVAILKDRSLTVLWNRSKPADLVLERPVANVHFTQKFIVLTTVVGDVYTFEEDGGITLVKTSLRTDINNMLTERLYRMNIDEVLSQCQQEDSLYNAFYTFSDTAFWYNYFIDQQQIENPRNSNDLTEIEYSFIILKIIKMNQSHSNHVHNVRGNLDVDMVSNQLLQSGDFTNSALYHFVTWLEKGGVKLEIASDDLGMYWFEAQVFERHLFRYSEVLHFLNLLQPDVQTRFGKTVTKKQKQQSQTEQKGLHYQIESNRFIYLN
jgi:hypothetical protein